MTPSGQTVCLCMIVRNEAPVIRRCLDSVRPLIDRWLIVDTGSTDGTQDIVREHVRDVAGELVERPWRDFAHNRSEALALARPHGDYTLIIDADDTLAVPDGFRWPVLEAGSYTVDIRDAGILYRRAQVVSNALPWRYVGVLHEFLACEEARTAGHVDLVMLRNHDGARRRDPETYRRDAVLLERALQAETDPFLVSRYTFYLAQSYRDCGELRKAVDLYLRRADLGYWDQEIFAALYQAAKIMEGLAAPRDDILRIYRRATAACPSRSEAVHGAARLCRLAGDHAQAYAVARPALGRSLPKDGLFVTPWIYAYGLDDEFAVSAYWTGHDRECAEATARILASPLLPASERPRIEANRRFALDRLATTARSVPGWQPSRPQGGTELMVDALRHRLGAALDAIDLRINLYDPATRDGRPLVVWLHHDVDQPAVQWCRDRALTERVSRFVLVSHWQKDRYVAAFALPPERCVVIRHVVDAASAPRRWEPEPVFRCAYTSTPFRGLDILLDVWERLPEGRAELHVWSSMKLYAMDDAPYRSLMDRARSMPGVVYHGLAPNAELRAALRTMHFHTYPSTFAETACLSVMEAMAAGCRVIVPSFGALPETTGGYARVYPWSPDKAVHADLFADVLAQEFAEPWDGRVEDAVSQQNHCAAVFSSRRWVGEWRGLIASSRTPTSAAAARSPGCLASPRAASGVDDVTSPGASAAPEEHSVLAEFDRRHPVTMHQDEIEAIVRAIQQAPDDALMVEWGSGASTLRWLREMRGAQRLIAIEHNKEWFGRVRAVLDSEPELARRVRYHLCPPNGYVDHGYGYPAEENPVGLDAYFSADPEMFDADIILIDGVARGVCAMLVHRNATKANVRVFLHDWWPRRPWYSWATRLYASADRVGETLCRLTR